jgi:hypothetical protein
LRVLALDEVAALVVQRIFALYLDGVGQKGIAEILNRDGVPCLRAFGVVQPGDGHDAYRSTV